MNIRSMVAIRVVEDVRGYRRRLVRAVVLGVSLFLARGAYGQQVILAGSDLWSTPGGGQTTHDFSQDPIPADFFGVGSEPFDGVVTLEGLPLNGNPGLAPPDGIDLGTTDTIVERLQDMSLQQTGDTASTPIEIVALSLQSVEPITVMINGEETRWNIEVQLPLSGQQPPGQMTIDHSIFDGGTFDATVPVNADLFFTDAATGEFFGSLNTQIELSATGVPWLFFPNVDVLELVDSIQLANGTTVLPTSLNFHTGYAINPETLSSKCVLSLEESQLIRHGVLPARKTAGPDADGDGISDACDNCPGTCNPMQEDADRDCVGDACEDGPGNPCMPDDVDIPAGDDCWHTECGGGTTFDFCNDGIPADFFGPGSDLFDGSVEMGSGDREARRIDTVVQRLDPIRFPSDEFPVEGSTPIELVELNLVSCEPITVTFDGGQNPQQWNVAVTLSETAQEPGTMTVTKTGTNGGTFTSDFPVQPLFTFTRVDDPTDVRVFDTGLEGLAPFSLSTIDASWVHELSFKTIVAPCGERFVPGVKEDPDTEAQCCFPVCHLANVPAHHCVVTGFECPCCPTGACCDPANGSCSVVEGSPPEGLCPEDVCVEMGGVYQGDNTDCSDGDGDGLADILETGGDGNCCEFDPSTPCSIGTDASNPDSDGDGCSDGEEVDEGTNPCDPCSAPPGCLEKDCNSNGVADECESDTDGDGVIDDCDNCPNDSNADQADADADDIGDACDDSVSTVIVPSTCGPGVCGTGSVAMLPVILLGLGLMKFCVARASRRRRSSIGGASPDDR